MHSHNFTRTKDNGLVEELRLPSMAELGKCWGHCERDARKSKISKLIKSNMQPVNEKIKILIKKGPISKELSLKEIEDIYSSGASWKQIEEGLVHSVPLEEIRVIDFPKPDRWPGQVEFATTRGGSGTKIENYTVVQTIANLNASILEEEDAETRVSQKRKGKKAKAAGKSEVESEKTAQAKAYHLPQFKAVKAWQDVEAEIKLKRAFEQMMEHNEIPSLIIRSVSKKAILALEKFGLKIPGGEGEIDLIMAYASGDFLNVIICEV